MMFGKIEYYIVNCIFLQATPDITTFLIDKGDKVSVIALLSLLVYTLHRQGEKSAEQIKLLHEARIADMEEEIKYLRSQIDSLKSK